MLLVWGVIRLGFWGVLLLVGTPVRTCAVPLVATLLNARLNVRRAALLPVLEIYSTHTCQRSGESGFQKKKDDLDDQLTSRCLANDTPEQSPSTRRQGTWDILITTILAEEFLNVETRWPVDVSGTGIELVNTHVGEESQHSLKSNKIGGLVKSIEQGHLSKELGLYPLIIGNMLMKTHEISRANQFRKLLTPRRGA